MSASHHHPLTGEQISLMQSATDHEKEYLMFLNMLRALRNVDEERIKDAIRLLELATMQARRAVSEGNFAPAPASAPVPAPDESQTIEQ